MSYIINPNTQWYFKFNGNWNDDSWNWRNLTVTNWTYWEAVFGNWLIANNASPTTAIWTAPDYFWTQALTISAWVKINALPISTVPQSYVFSWVENTIDSNIYDKGLLIDWSGRAVFHCYDWAVKESLKSWVSAWVWCNIWWVFTWSQIITYVNWEPWTPVSCSGTFNFTTPKWGICPKDSTIQYTRFWWMIDELIIENIWWTEKQFKDFYLDNVGKFNPILI